MAQVVSLVRHAGSPAFDAGAANAMLAMSIAYNLSLQRSSLSIDGRHANVSQHTPNVPYHLAGGMRRDPCRSRQGQW